LIGGAVRSILNGAHSSIEVVVVDQSTGTETRDALDFLAGDLRLRYLHSDRVGLSAAYNTGIAATSASLIAFTDDDCIAPPDWASSVLTAFSSNPDADLLYGQVTAATEVDSTAGVIPTLEFTQRRRLSDHHGFEVFGMGANFAARRSLFESLGGFDEVLGGGGPLRSSQDFDLQFRAYRHGVVCLLEPSVTVVHYGLREHHRWPGTLTAYGVGDGGFYMKHVRCGDLVATKIFARRLLLETGRVLFKPLLRRKHSPAYLRGMLAGARGSFRFSIDRRERTYLVRPAPQES
ncbi:MAG: glycosyltransferase family 2 protein, partial [Anaerolineales bacterium]